jgi:hypothetical protein
MSNVRPHLRNGGESQRYAPPAAVVADEKPPPRLRSSVLWGLAIIAAAVLANTNLDSSIQSAGPYKFLTVVWFSVLAGLFLSYLPVLQITVLVLSRPMLHLSWPGRYAIVAGAAFASSLALVFVPLLPYFSLAVICKVQALCPMAANPIAWSLSGAVRYGAAAPIFCVVAALVVAVVAIRTRRLFTENEA